MIPDKHAKLMKIFWGCKCTKQPRNLCTLQSLFSCLRNTLLHLKIFVFRVIFMKFNQFCNFLGWVTWRRVEFTATLSHAFIIRILKSRWWGSIEMRKLCSWFFIQNVCSRKLWVDFHCEISMSRLIIPRIPNCYWESGPGCIIWNYYWDWIFVKTRNAYKFRAIFPLFVLFNQKLIISKSNSRVALFRSSQWSIRCNRKIYWH